MGRIGRIGRIGNAAPRQKSCKGKGQNFPPSLSSVSKGMESFANITWNFSQGLVWKEPFRKYLCFDKIPQNLWVNQKSIDNKVSIYL